MQRLTVPYLASKPDYVMRYIWALFKVPYGIWVSYDPKYALRSGKWISHYIIHCYSIGWYWQVSFTKRSTKSLTVVTKLITNLNKRFLTSLMSNDKKTILSTEPTYFYEAIKVLNATNCFEHMQDSEQ